MPCPSWLRMHEIAAKGRIAGLTQRGDTMTTCLTLLRLTRIKVESAQIRPAALALAAGLSVMGAGDAYAQSSARPLVIARNMDLNSLDPHRSFCDTCQIYNSTV